MILFVSLCSLLFLTSIRAQSQGSPDLTSTCFKDVPIYQSNSPYGVEKRNDLICVAHPREVQDNSDQALINRTNLVGVTSRLINVNSSASLPIGTQLVLGTYQVGTPIFRSISTTPLSVAYYSLPVARLGNGICSGFQPITYMTDFTSTCSQLVSATNCVDALDATKYNSNFCLFKSPADVTSNGTPVCCNLTTAITTSSAPVCTNALQTLTLNIFYTNPTGITSCTVSATAANATVNTLFAQTFSVRFFPNGGSTTRTSLSGNPGYLSGAPVLAARISGTSLISTPLTIVRASSTGDCDTTTTNPSMILFGRKSQSVCQLSTACPTTVAALNSIFTNGLDPSAFQIGIQGNSDLTNPTQWLSPTICTSDFGSTAASCSSGPLVIQTNQCYNRLDIEIAYAKVGSVNNAQSVIGAVVFHYRRIATPSSTPILFTQTVSFQEVSIPPVTQNGLIPQPNTRILGDFFYPFSLNSSPSFSFSLSVLFLSFFLFIFVSD